VKFAHRVQVCTEPRLSFIDKSQEGKQTSRPKVIGLAGGRSKAETFEASKSSKSRKKAKAQEEE
jgi:6-phosphogluconolactonase/glucosamine-6-phosphate isomerase/deaminase